MPGKRGDGVLRAEAILRELSDPNGVHSREALLEKFNIGTDSLNKDIRYLRDNGVIIKYKSGEYFLNDSAEKTVVFEKSVGGYAKKIPVFLAIMKVINKKGQCTRIDLKRTLANECINKGVDPSEIDIQIENALYGSRNHDNKENASGRGLIAKGLVKEIEKNRYIIPKNVPTVFEMTVDDAYDLQMLLQSHVDENAMSDELKRVERYLEMILFGRKAHEEGCYNMNKKKDSDLTSLLLKLADIPFESNIIVFEYEKTDGVKEWVTFETGLLVFSEERNRLFFIGRREKSNIDEIIDVSKIDLNTVRTDSRENCAFKNSYYQNLFDESFDVSVDEPVKVKIIFENFGNVFSKVNNLSQRRKNASVDIQEAEDGFTIVYRDIIRGEDDFARYLLKYGSSVHIAEPNTLRIKMTEILRMIEKRYISEAAYE